ncbi:MAG TPA: hypothetical protein VFN30_10535 [Chitinophagaceae bacterium]|nr:hypothetical protein [Chitinophagaceae bacterium]
MQWLRKRLGCSGKGRLEVIECLKTQLTSLTQNDLKLSIGLNDEDLEQLATRYDFSFIAKHIPHRGDSDNLKLIAWFGSAITDLACWDLNENKEDILVEGALFNLGISLFDSVIDEIPNKKLELLHAINVSGIEKRIIKPNDEESRLASNDNVINHIAIIFDGVFSSLGKRMPYSPNEPFISELIRLIRLMYNSEVRVDENPFNAKSLPIIFLGKLGITNSFRPETEVFYNKLGQFIQIYDDWMDMADDFLKGKPNYFFNNRIFYPSFLKYVVYYFNFFKRIISGSIYHSQTAAIVGYFFREVMHASAATNNVLYKKNIVLCQKIIFH